MNGPGPSDRAHMHPHPHAHYPPPPPMSLHHQSGGQGHDLSLYMALMAQQQQLELFKNSGLPPAHPSLHASFLNGGRVPAFPGQLPPPSPLHCGSGNAMSMPNSPFHSLPTSPPFHFPSSPFFPTPQPSSPLFHPSASHMQLQQQQQLQIANPNGPSSSRTSATAHSSSQSISSNESPSKTTPEPEHVAQSPSQKPTPSSSTSSSSSSSSSSATPPQPVPMVSLADGKLKPMDAITTVDLTECASKSGLFKVQQSTVSDIKVTESGRAVVTFEVGLDRKVVRHEVPADYPYFVYHRGWASCDPGRTSANCNINCARLKARDPVMVLIRAEGASFLSHNNSNGDGDKGGNASGAEAHHSKNTNCSKKTQSKKLKNC